MSNNTEKPERGIASIARYTSPFSREALRSVYEVNELFLGWLVHATNLNDFERTIQAQLAVMPADSLRLVAECPFLLVDAKFQEVRAWRELLKQNGNGESCDEIGATRYDPSRICLARSTFFAAWYIAHRWPCSAELLIGADQDVIASLSQIELTRLATLAEWRTSWISPRWADRPDVWIQLLAAATSAARGTPVSLRQRALQLLLGRLLG